MEVQTDPPWVCEGNSSLQKEPLLKAKSTLYKNLDKPNIALWYLERKAKDEYSTKQEIAVSGDSDKPIVYLPENDRDKAGK